MLKRNYSILTSDKNYLISILCLESVCYIGKINITTYEERFYSFSFEVLMTLIDVSTMLSDVMPLALVEASRYLQARRISQASNMQAIACCFRVSLLSVVISGHC
jgi:hypothetical protein